MDFTDDDMVNVSKTKHLKCCYYCRTIQSRVPKEKNSVVRKMLSLLLRQVFVTVHFVLCLRDSKKDLILSGPYD